MKHIKKSEDRKVRQPASNYFFLPLSLFALLLIGTVVSLVQLQHNQSNQSRATISLPPPSLVIQDCTVTPDQLTIKASEQTFFDQINAYRQQHGIAPLIWSTTLKRASAWMSNDMLTHAALSHTDSLGRDTLVRLEQCGYFESTDVGENIDNGTSDNTIILSAWESAPAQNANLLDPSFINAGISLATGPNNQAFWTLDLGGISPTFVPTATTIPTPTSLPTPTSGLTRTPTATPTPVGGVTAIPTATLAPTAGPGATATPIPPTTPQATPTPFAQPTFATTPHPISPTPTPVPFVANPNDMQVFVSLKLAGLGKDGNAKPKHLSRHVQVTVFDATNKSIVNGSGFLSFDGDLFRGTIHLGKLANGTYYVKVVGDNTLQGLILPQFQSLSTDKLNMLPEITLLQGDLNIDNVIDLNDFTLLLLCFQDTKCQNKNAIDFTDNGVVDIVDYNLFLQSFLSHSGD